jgi:hypothetical protein
VRDSPKVQKIKNYSVVKSCIPKGRKKNLFFVFVNYLKAVAKSAWGYLRCSSVMSGKYIERKKFRELCDKMNA